MTEPIPSAEPRTAPTTALALSTGAMVALADGFVGLIASGWTAPKWSEWLAPALVSGFAVAFVVALACRLLCDLTARSQVPPLALQLALAFGGFGLLAASILAALSGQGVYPFAWKGALVGAVVFAVIGYAFGSRTSERGDGSAVVAAWCLALPLCTTIACATFWVVRFELRPGKLVLVVIAGVALCACAVVIVALAQSRARIRPAPWLALGFAAALVAAFLGRTSSAESPPRSTRELAPAHVILIVVDTLRGDELSCASPSAPPTPNIDAFAKESLVFTAARSSAPWTLPAVTSLLTGVDADVHRALREDVAVPTELETLAERMHAAGYRTAALGRNSMLLPHTRLDQGFDEYLFDAPLHGVPPLGADLLERFGPARATDFPSDRALTTAGAAWIEAHRSEPFFLWLHLFDPHAPYEPSRELLPPGAPPRRIGPAFSDMAGVRSGHLVLDAQERAWLRTLYDAEVREVDASLGQLFERLRERGLYDDALIVLTADHGEEFWDHDAYEHGHTEYDELLRVPLIVKLPRGAGAQRDARLASTARLAPSLLTACGVPFDAAQFSGGALFTATGAAGEPENVPSMLATGTLYFEGQSALILGSRKYVWHEVSGREELYDLASDPQELHDLADRNAAALESMRAAFDARIRDGAALRKRLGLREVERSQIDHDALRALRGLGYVK